MKPKKNITYAEKLAVLEVFENIYSIAGTFF